MTRWYLLSYYSLGTAGCRPREFPRIAGYRSRLRKVCSVKYMFGQELRGSVLPPVPLFSNSIAPSGNNYNCVKNPITATEKVLDPRNHSPLSDLSIITFGNSCYCSQPGEPSTKKRRTGTFSFRTLEQFDSSILPSYFFLFLSV